MSVRAWFGMRRASMGDMKTTKKALREELKALAAERWTIVGQTAAERDRIREIHARMAEIERLTNKHVERDAILFDTTR